MKENKMLGLVAEIKEANHTERNETYEATASIRDIVKDLIRTKKQAEQIGEDEIYYLTSMALESAKEKMLLEIYENR
jgi:hypothetical protein